MSKDALMPRTQFSALSILYIIVLMYAAESATAQEVRWRHDYTAARRESAETGRPLFVDFSTESCFWCKKLDAVTWRDPKIVKMLNEQFIPVKLDGVKEERLARSLAVEGYPTLIVATTDGKVVGRHAGYLDPTQMAALLGKAPAPDLVPKAPPAAAPMKAVAVVANDTIEDERRVKARLDAELAALHSKIAASLER